MLFRIGALSSGAVSSSWMWNLLTSVFTVINPASRLSGHHRPLEGAIGRPHFTKSQLLTWSKLYLVLSLRASPEPPGPGTGYTHAGTALVQRFAYRAASQRASDRGADRWPTSRPAP